VSDGASDEEILFAVLVGMICIHGPQVSSSLFFPLFPQKADGSFGLLISNEHPHLK
jgi:hypothetical protein